MYSMTTGSVLHLYLFDHLASCMLVKLLHAVDSALDLVKDVSPHEAS